MCGVCVSASFWQLWCSRGVVLCAAALLYLLGVGRVDCPTDANKYKCCNGNCVKKSYNGDGDNDCGDNSDEDGKLSTCHGESSILANAL